MIVGDLVMVLDKLDSRVRDKDKTVLTIGTVDQMLCDNQISVLLENGDIWVGDKRLTKVVE